MIVMLSAHRRRRILRGARPSAGRPGCVPPVARPGVWAAHDTPGRTGQGRLVAMFQLVDNGCAECGRCNRAKVFSSHTRWTASPQAVRVPRVHRYSLSSVTSPAGTQGERRVCTGCPQTCAQSDWTWSAARRRLSQPSCRTVCGVRQRGSTRRPRDGEVRRMSVAELAPRGGEFERTPPHDLAAEQCALGGMLMSKDAISDVMEVISPNDHYRPAHQLVHEAILDLYGRGEPADPVTVSDHLAKRGELARVGGGAYLHTLLASVPTAANAGYYARIVRERAILRRLVEAGTRIVQLGYTGDGDADELVDRAEAEIYGVTERRVSE